MRYLLLAILLLVGCTEGGLFTDGPSVDQDHIDAVVAVSIARARQVQPDGPDPGKCPCGGTGYVGDPGNETPCRCGGPSSCGCKGSYSLQRADTGAGQPAVGPSTDSPAREASESARASAEARESPRGPWGGTYSDAYAYAREHGSATLVLHEGDAEPTPGVFHLDLSAIPNREIYESYFNPQRAPYPLVTRLVRAEGRVVRDRAYPYSESKSRDCRSGGS